RGQSGHVERLSLPASQASRLAGLGLCEGRLVEVISTGDPAIVRVCGSTLAVGRSLAKGVEMCVCRTQSCPHESSRRPAGGSPYTPLHTDAAGKGEQA
ncbi:MAG: FeoA family protein, partial [Phycisphaeraceae bacterium]